MAAHQKFSLLCICRLLCQKAILIFIQELLRNVKGWQNFAKRNWWKCTFSSAHCLIFSNSFRKEVRIYCCVLFRKIAYFFRLFYMRISLSFKDIFASIKPKCRLTPRSYFPNEKKSWIFLHIVQFLVTFDERTFFCLHFLRKNLYVNIKSRRKFLSENIKCFTEAFSKNAVIFLFS